jgi:colicin import membrane protein
LSDDQNIKEQNKKAALKAIGSAQKGSTISLSFFPSDEDDGVENSRRDAQKKAERDAAEARKREAQAKVLETKRQEDRRVGLEQKQREMQEKKAAVEEEKRAMAAEAAEERSRRLAVLKAAADAASEERRRQAEINKTECIQLGGTS